MPSFLVSWKKLCFKLYNKTKKLNWCQIQNEFNHRKLYSCMRFGNNFYSIFTFVINQQEVKKCISFLARFSSFVLCGLTVALQEGSLPRASISMIWTCGRYRAARMCKCAMLTQEEMKQKKLKIGHNIFNMYIIR